MLLFNDRSLIVFFIAAGIKSIQVSLLSQKADITYDSSCVTPDNIVQQIVDCGFGASLLEVKDVGGLCSVDVHVCIN